jgi:hypothetical protein
MAGVYAHHGTFIKRMVHRKIPEELNCCGLLPSTCSPDTLEDLLPVRCYFYPRAFCVWCEGLGTSNPAWRQLCMEEVHWASPDGLGAFLKAARTGVYTHDAYQYRRCLHTSHAHATLLI